MDFISAIESNLHQFFEFATTESNQVKAFLIITLREA